MAYLYRKNRSPFWYVVYIDADKKEVHRSTGLRADNPNDTAKAKALRAELEAKEHHRVPTVNSEGWDTWVPKYLERHCETKRTLERYDANAALEIAGYEVRISTSSLTHQPRIRAICCSMDSSTGRAIMNSLASWESDRFSTRSMVFQSLSRRCL